MNNAITFVQGWLLPDEQIISSVDEVKYDSENWYQAHYIDKDNRTPITNGSLVLTNRRLIIVEHLGESRLPRWYSVTCIASLQERPPEYIEGWPYQARLTLYSGAIITIEPPKNKKDKTTERGKELSKFLNEVFISLDTFPKMGSQMAEFIEAEKRRSSSR